MISHRHKCIFIHIPKSAGTSIYRFFNPDVNLDYKIPNYDIHYGWCPKRKIHMQHADLKQLLEMELLSPLQAETYFKFTFVRNPYDRIYSDYFWMRKTTKIRDSFKNYILRKGGFEKVLTDHSTIDYRGDHLKSQKSYLLSSGETPFDYIGRFENFNADISQILSKLAINKPFTIHENLRGTKKKHYSYFISPQRKSLIDTICHEDKHLMDYKYVDKKNDVDNNSIPYMYYDWLISKQYA